MNIALSRLWLLLLASLTLAALFGMTFNIWPGVPVRNDLMHLLPDLRDDTVLLQALERSNNALSRKLIILVSTGDPAQTDAAATIVLDSISQQSFFDKPMTGINATQGADMGRFYYQWRQVLLSPSQRELIATHNFDGMQQWLAQTVYSPVSGVSGTLLANDPLLTFYDYLRSLPAGSGHVQSENGNLVVHGTDRDYRVIIVDIRRDVFDMDFHPLYEDWRLALQKRLHELSPDSQLQLAGAVEHAVWGASSAKREVNTIGNGSLLGIIVLIVLVFPGFRPLVLSLLPLGAGVIAGLVLTLLCFGEIHLITLVFGSSVIGVAMDYSLHFMSDHYKNSERDTPALCLKRVFPGITFAMITSAISYAAIGFAPFPILRQIALFSCAGLVMAWFSVVSLYPYVLPAAHYKTRWYLDASGKFDDWLRHLFDRKASKLALMLLALAMLPGVLRIQANDDMRLLQTPKQSITDTEKSVQTLTGIQGSGHFFLIEGATLEIALQRCEALDDWLAVHEPATHVDLITHFLPSQQRQQENFRLQRSLYFNDDNTSTATFARQWQQKLGLPDAVLDQQQQAFATAPENFLTLDAMTASNNPVLQSMLLQSIVDRFQLTKTARGYIAAATVTGSENPAALRDYASAHPGVHWMDTVSDISALLKHYREQTGWMMVIAYGLIAMLLFWRYPPAAAVRVLIAPALSAWLTLGLLGYAGVPLNLFHVLALLLVLGVGIDYSIFFAESDEHRDTTMLAVLLSTITTLLSFGLLSLSQTAAISSFGVVVSLGITCSLLLSPLAQYHPVTSAEPRHS